MLKSIIITLLLLVNGTQQIEMKEFPETGLISNGKIDNAQYYDRAHTRYELGLFTEIQKFSPIKK